MDRTEAGYEERAERTVRYYIQQSTDVVWQVYENLQIEIVGPPLTCPRHKDLHRPAGPTPAEAAAGNARIMDQYFNPISNAIVTLRAGPVRDRLTGEITSYPVVQESTTDAKGEFSFGRLPEDDYVLKVQHVDFADTNVTLRIGPPPFRPFTLIVPSLSAGERASADYEGGPSNTFPTVEMECPEVTLLAAVFSEGYLLEWFDVHFYGERVLVRPSRASGDHDDRLSPLRQETYFAVRSSTEKFFRDAFDISRGPERFYPYFPQDIYRALGYEVRRDVRALQTDEEVRRRLALDFDSRIYRVLMAYEGMAPPLTAMADVIGGNYPPPAEEIARHNRVRSRLLESDRDRMRASLRKLGALQPEHLRAVTSYLRRSWGEGPVFGGFRSRITFQIIYDDLYLIVQHDDAGIRLVGRVLPNVF